MANNAKNFLVSTADFAYYVDKVLACTGTTTLNASSASLFVKFKLLQSMLTTV